MHKPRVSIGLPVYNGERYLPVALRTILEQDFEDFELIISDNASQDGTSEICREYCKSDRRIKYSRLDVNQGAAPNYQRVFHLASGDYFKWAAHDDACLPGFLSRCIDEIERAPSSVVLVYPKAEIIDAEGNVMRVDDETVESRDHRSHRRAAHVVMNVDLAWPLFGVIRADVLRKTRLIDSFIGSDYVLLAELAMLGQIWEIPEVLMQRRVHAGMSNVVHKSRAQWSNWMDSARSRRKAPLPDWIQIGWQCAKSSWQLPLSAKQSVMCCTIVPLAWFWRKLHSLAGKYKKRFVSVFTDPKRVVESA